MKQATARPLRTLILNITNKQLQAPSTSLSRSCRSHEPCSLERRLFSSNTRLLQHGPEHSNRILNAFRKPPQFHDALRLCSANNTLLLALFTTSACTPCRVITPLLTSLIETRPPSPADKYTSLAFAELELDSPDTSNGSMMDLGVEYGVTSMPTLMGFGGRRAERVTERVVDTRLLTDEVRLAKWLDVEMGKGDPFPTVAGGGGGSSGQGGLLSRIFG